MPSFDPSSEPSHHVVEAEAQAARLEDASPEDVLHWTFDTYGEGAVLGTGFGTSGIVLLHMVSQLRPEATVFYLDTDLLFDETLAQRDRLAERLGLTFTRILPDFSLEEQARQHGPALWRSAPDRCCCLRKVEPLRRFLHDQQAWITGLRRDQSASRAHTPVVTWDVGNRVMKVSPLTRWTEKDVWRYLHRHDLPYNPLHDRGFPSVGCRPCTQPVEEGEELRSGRWRGRAKTECGIHLSP